MSKYLSNHDGHLCDVLDIRQTLELKNPEDPLETAHHVMDLELPANQNFIVGLLLSDCKGILYLFDFIWKATLDTLAFIGKRIK